MRVLRVRHEIFIVRLTGEGEDHEATNIWRGQIEHIQTRQSWRFTRLEDLAHIIAAVLKPDKSHSAPDDDEP